MTERKHMSTVSRTGYTKYTTYRPNVPIDLRSIGERPFKSSSSVSCRLKVGFFRGQHYRDYTVSRSIRTYLRRSNHTSMSDDRAAELKGPYFYYCSSRAYSYLFFSQRGWPPVTRTSENPGCEPWKPVLSVTSFRVAIVLKASTTMRPAASSRRSISHF